MFGTNQTLRDLLVVVFYFCFRFSLVLNFRAFSKKVSVPLRVASGFVF